MHISPDRVPMLDERLQAGLRRDGLKEGEEQLPKQAPSARAC